MNLHFGPTKAAAEGLYMDFVHGKREYQRMESWNPTKAVSKKFERPHEEAHLNALTEKLLERSKKRAAQF